MVWQEGRFTRKKNFLLKYKTLDSNIEYLFGCTCIYKKRIKKQNINDETNKKVFNDF